MSDTSKGTLPNEPDTELDQNLVAEFLTRHPDFFSYNLDLLNGLDIPHPSGRSVSLIERQVASLRQENGQLKQKLAELIATARTNELLLEKTRKLILAVMESRNYGELRSTVETSLVREFAASACVLWLIDKDDPANRQVALATAQSLLGRLVTQRTAFCGLLKAAECEFLFREKSAVTESAAVLPLYQEDSLVAILAIGNQNRDYYRNNVSTNILSYIGDIVVQMIRRLAGKL